MPNRNRHRQTQQMNTRQQQPIVAVQVNPSQLWAEQPSVIVTAEVACEPVAPRDTADNQRLKDQVAQLKKSNKDHKKNFKMLSKTTEECVQKLEKQEEFFRKNLRFSHHRLNELNDQAKHFALTGLVEGGFTDRALGFGCGGVDATEILTFDLLKHPDEMPQNQGLVDELCEQFAGSIFDKLNADLGDYYRWTAQTSQGMFQWGMKHSEENDKRLSKNMFVQPSFDILATDYIQCGGVVRHFLCGWDWARYASEAEGIRMRIPPKETPHQVQFEEDGELRQPTLDEEKEHRVRYEKAWEDYPERHKCIPMLNEKEAQKLYRVIKLAEDLLEKLEEDHLEKRGDLEGSSPYLPRHRQWMVTIPQVAKIVTSTVEKVKELWKQSMLRNFQEYLMEEMDDTVWSFSD